MKLFRFAIAICLLSFICSCGRNNGEDALEYAQSLRDSTSITGLTGDSVKLVKTASTSIKVKDVEQSIRTVSNLARKLGGMLTLQNMEVTEEGRKELKLSSDSLIVITSVAPRADITARIPSQNLEAFLFEVADLGYFTINSRLQIDDRSLAYLENVLKQKNRNEMLSQSVFKQKSSATPFQTVATKDQAIEQEIANRTINADVNYSTVNLNLYQNTLIKKETVANTYLDNYVLSFWKRLGNAFENGWEYFLNFVVAIMHLWMLICLGILIFISYRYWQKGKLT